MCRWPWWRVSYDWEWVGAEEEFRRAIALNPSYATAHQWYGESLASWGRFAEAETEVKRAQELDPLSPIVNMAVAEVYAWEHRDDEAIAQYKKVLELDPSFAGAYGNLAASYQWKGRYAEAVNAMAKDQTLNGNPELAAVLERAYAQSGFPAVIREELKNALAEQSKRYVNPVELPTFTRNWAMLRMRLSGCRKDTKPMPVECSTWRSKEGSTGCDQIPGFVTG